MLTMITFGGINVYVVNIVDNPMNHTHYHYEGKWALVTEASSGIGRAFAYELAARGANLISAPEGQKRLPTSLAYEFSCAQYNQ